MEDQFTYQDLMNVQRRCSESSVDSLLEEYSGKVIFQNDEIKKEFKEEVARMIRNYNRQ